jgi:hypothetical protein
MLSLGGNNDPYDVVKEMELSHSLKRLCLFGSDEDADITNSFRKTGAKVEILPGGITLTMPIQVLLIKF